MVSAGKTKNQVRLFKGHFGQIVKNHKAQSELCNSYKKETWTEWYTI